MHRERENSLSNNENVANMHLHTCLGDILIISLISYEYSSYLKIIDWDARVASLRRARGANVARAHQY